MKQYFSVIKRSPLFHGLLEQELGSMLSCLSARTERYQKGQYVFRHGDTVTQIGMVLSGSVHMIKEDFWGNLIILGTAAPGQLFGESFACLHTEPLGVNVLAPENSVVLFLDIRKVTTVCSAACEFHTRLIRNLFSVLAEKNLQLTKKLEHMAQRTTREKLLSYLSAQSQLSGSPVFEIPFNRQQLADYLSVDRSAMSSELGKLRREGVIGVQKNRFELKAVREQGE